MAIKFIKYEINIFYPRKACRSENEKNRSFEASAGALHGELLIKSIADSDTLEWLATTANWLLRLAGNDGDDRT